MKIVIAFDHGGITIRQEIISLLEEMKLDQQPKKSQMEKQTEAFWYVARKSE